MHGWAPTFAREWSMILGRFYTKYQMITTDNILTNTIYQQQTKEICSTPTKYWQMLITDKCVRWHNGFVVVRIMHKKICVRNLYAHHFHDICRLFQADFSIKMLKIISCNTAWNSLSSTVSTSPSVRHRTTECRQWCIVLPQMAEFMVVNSKHVRCCHMWQSSHFTVSLPRLWTEHARKIHFFGLVA